MAPKGVEMSQIDPDIVGNSSGADSAGGFEGVSGLRMRGRQQVEEEEDDFEDEHAVQQEPPTLEEKKWAGWAVMVSIVDLVMSGVICIMSFSFAYRSIGASLYCLGIQSLSHWLSSLALALRCAGENSHFYSSDNSPTSNSLLRRHRRRFLVREQILSITMGIVMLVSSAALLFKAFRKIKFWHVWYKDAEMRAAMDGDVEWATEFLAWYGFSIYLLQAVFRFFAARRLRRSICWHAFVASVVSLLFLLVMGIAASYEKQWSWKAEPIAAIALAFVTLAEGVRIIIMHLDDMDTRLRFDPRA
mmetsp:Transcript_67234/g.173114  ORF Transcript_67234/g.173114 Transcript_67234/m.173114 type:complete len:302 (+) Transcript_67234:84-989(+)